MKNYEKYLVGEKFISIPLLQYKHNLSYLDAKKIIDDLIAKEHIEKMGGYSYAIKSSGFERNLRKEIEKTNSFLDDDFFDNLFKEEYKLDKLVAEMKSHIEFDEDNTFYLVDEEFIKDSIVKISFKENEDGTYQFSDNGYTYGRLLIRYKGINKYRENKMNSILKKYNLELVESNLISKFTSYDKALSSYINLYSVIVLLNNI